MEEKLDWNDLLAQSSSWDHFVCCREREIDSFARLCPEDSAAVVRILRGRRCTTRESLFQEWAAALQFPYYFGANWDAFEECLTDLEWLPGTRYLLFLTNVDQILIKDDPAFVILVQILEKAAEEWRDHSESRSNLPRLFRVVFHCEPEAEAFTRNRLKTYLTAR